MFFLRDPNSLVSDGDDGSVASLRLIKKEAST